MQIPAGIAADAAIARQNVALSAIKSNADQAQAVAEIVEESAARTAPTSGSRGTTIDISV